MSRALEGIRVLDLSDRSAALAGRILADLGATVILVEPPDGASIRHRAPFLEDRPGPERSFHHLYLSANKKSVVLQASPEDDPDVWPPPAFLHLVAEADIVIDTARPGTRQGLEHGLLRSVNPRLIQISVTPFGLSDEREWKGNDLIAGAAGGLVGVSGERKGIPVQGGAMPSYCMASIAAASAATIALHQRDAGRAPDGVHVDLSLQEATVMAVMQTANPTHWTWHGRIPSRPGLSSALRCRDGGHVGLLVRPDRFPAFLSWCDEVGVEHDMTEEDWRWARLTAPRKGNPVSAATLALTRALTRDEFVAGALKADIVCLPVLDFEDLSTHEQFVMNDQFLEVAHAGLDQPLGFVRSPVDGMGDGVTLHAAPLLGEHTQEFVSASPAAVRSKRDGATSTSDPSRALEGLRVVDFGWVLAAPIGTRLLASFGAEVIRIESNRRPDSMRSQLGPDGKPDPDLGGLYNTVNAGKKSFAVDVSTEAGLALVHDLIRTADIVTSNFRPGALERMGLGYAKLKSLKSDIILLNLPGAHPKGPWAVRASMGNILMAASGFNMLTGFDGEPPRGIGVAYPDFVSPHLMVASLLAAVRHRDRTGEGQEIQTIQLSTTLSLLGVEWMQFRASGRQPMRNGNRSAGAAPHGVYPTRGDDVWLAIAVSNDAEWHSFCTVIDRPDLVDDERFASLTARKRNEDALDAIVSDWTCNQERWECADRLQSLGIAASPVANLQEMVERDPLLRDHYQTVYQPVAPEVPIPIDREVAQWVGAPLRLRRAPGFGEHNAEVVRDLLRRSDDELTQLILDGVVQ